MTNKIKKRNGGAEIFKMFLFSVLVAALVSAILLIVIAVLLDQMGFTEKQVRLLVYVVYILSALAAGFVAGKCQHEKKFLWGALTGAVWLVLILITSLVVNGTGIEGKELFPAVVCMIGGGMLGGMLA